MASPIPAEYRSIQDVNQIKRSKPNDDELDVFPQTRPKEEKGSPDYEPIDRRLTRVAARGGDDDAPTWDHPAVLFRLENHGFSDAIFRAASH